MAKRTAPGRTAPKRRKERRPFIPPGTVINPVEPAVPPEPVPTLVPSPSTRSRAAAKDRLPRFGLPLNTDYSYVARDLRRILILTGIIVGVMIALTFVLPG
ncbi:MAG: hypothetical protein RMM58_10695 [Chloroflexota bacterium]|nr:hypothetical protein [Dehalococcoidia bacterium]MDW8254333.1 hypothetical protein [Chloroflexota bacterium]